MLRGVGIERVHQNVGIDDPRLNRHRGFRAWPLTSFTQARTGDGAA
jgi:hypothetical protein